MSALRRILGRAAKVPGTDKIRRGAGAFVAPNFRGHITSLHQSELDHNHRLANIELYIGEMEQRLADEAALDDLRDHVTSLYHTRLDHNHRLTELQTRIDGLFEANEEVQRYMPQILNAIQSTHGSERLLRREFEAAKQDWEVQRREAAGENAKMVESFQERIELAEKTTGDRVEWMNDHLSNVDDHLASLDGHVGRIDGHIAEDLWPVKSRMEGVQKNSDTLAWLVTRVETVRAEMLHELRYGNEKSVGDGEPIEIEIVNPDALAASGEEVRLNLGCGHIPMDGFVNIDMRKLPGVDVVAPVGDLPFEPRSVDEVFSAHVLEHFPEVELVRTLLPYWFSLLRPGGKFRAVVPDLESMIAEFSDGKMTFENLRAVTYGGQEYDGDFHFNGFTGETLGALLRAAGFNRIKVIESGRPNGDCLEFEISAQRPK